MPALPAHVRHGYGVGALAIAIANTSVLIFLLKFLVDEARLDPATAGTVLLVAKIWDAAVDPAIGRLTDRTGGRRRWVAGAAVPLAICFAGLWWGLPFTGTAQAVAYATLLVVYNTLFSAAVIPYGALTPALTEDYDDRTRLNAARMGWSMVGGIVAGIGMPVLLGIGGWRLAGCGLALLVAPPFFVTWWATRGREPARSPADAARGGLPWEVLRNRAFRRVAILFVCAWSSIAALSALVPFYVQHHLRAPQLLDALFAAIQLSALVAIPGVVWLAGRLEKHVAYAIGMGVWAAMLFALALVPAGAGMLAVGIGVLTGPGVAAAHVLPWAMLPDVVEVDTLDTGADRTGDFYGMMTFLEQVATALALGALGHALGLAGYVEGAATQGEAARLAIRVLIGPVPGLVLLGAALFAWARPPLTRADHRAAVARLHAGGEGGVRARRGATSPAVATPGAPPTAPSGG